MVAASQLLLPGPSATLWPQNNFRDTYCPYPMPSQAQPACPSADNCRQHGAIGFQQNVFFSFQLLPSRSCTTAMISHCPTWCNMFLEL